MKSLLNFLLKYNSLIVFLILEGIAFSFLTSSNSYHYSRVQKGLIGLTKDLELRISNTKSYLSLREINQQLAFENTALKNSLSRISQSVGGSFSSVNDTVLMQQYEYTAAEVINNSVTRQKNFFTINKGRLQGINTDMAVTGPGGVAGLIVGCSDNYSVAISLLNIDFKLSARIKSAGVFGSLNWDGRNYRTALLNEIPQHITINIGDTVETTGFSAVFPQGLMIGTITEFEKSGSDFYRIKVALFNDFRQLQHVTVIGNLKKREQHLLENQFQ